MVASASCCGYARDCVHLTLFFGENIMKRLFLIAAVLLAVSVWAAPAAAFHHRGHAVVHLENAIVQLVSARLNLGRWENSLANPDPSFFSSTRFNLEAAIMDCEEAIALLQDGADLDIIRRRLTKPTISSPEATVNSLFFTLYEVAFTVVGTDGANYDQFHRVIRRLTHGWRNVDMAIWHVQDATREEVYNDPAFQE